jgi:rhamnosyltransferase
MNMPSVAGVVVLYNSENAVINNILSYLDQIERLFVIDNSDLPNLELVKIFKGYPKITYISYGRNVGIAEALNKGAEEAIKQGFKFLLTMDDDTSVPANMVGEMISFIESQKGSKIGIVAPQSVSRLVSNTVNIAFIVITSGNLLNLKAYEHCGPFMDELFIDWVDHEYCMRLKKNGYSIFELNCIFINHRLGKRKAKHLFGVNIEWTSHSPIRLYYKTRNTLHVMSKYAFIIPLKFHLIFLYELIKDLIKNTLLEKNRRERIRYIVKAISDYINNNMGKAT